MNSKVTFKDVAKLAGVSTQTVSRVTNHAANVNEETRKRVQAAIDQLGYVPNKSAQQLVRKKAKVFGVLTLDLSLQGSSRIVEGIRNEGKKSGYAISLAVIDDGNDSIDEIIRDFKSQQVDAILVNVPVEKEKAEELVRVHQTIPFVFIDVDPAAQVNQVMADHYEGARLAAELMVEQGRERLAFINGPECSHAARLRREAWVAVAEKSGVKIINEVTGDWGARSGYIGALDLFAKAESFDAILVANDQMAIGVLRACREQQVDVPRQVAVIGFDDTVNSEYFCPPLTTIHQDFVDIGHQAVTEILSAMKKADCPPTQIQVPVRLVERRSTGPVLDSSDQAERLQSLLSELKRVIP